MILCPYAAILSSSYGLHALIHQYDDTRKIKKLIKSDYHWILAPFFTKNLLLELTPTDIKLNVSSPFLLYETIGLSLTSTEHLIL